MAKCVPATLGTQFRNFVAHVEEPLFVGLRKVCRMVNQELMPLFVGLRKVCRMVKKMGKTNDFLEKLQAATFSSYEEAIAKYRNPEIKIWLPAPLELEVRPLPCNMEDDLVMPQVTEIVATTIIYRLEQFRCLETGAIYWRYCRKP